MNLLAIKIDDNRMHCNQCILFDLCGSALARSVEEYYKLPKCHNGKYIFKVEDGDTKGCVDTIKKEMLSVLHTRLGRSKIKVKLEG